MEKLKLITTRKSKGFSVQDMADMLDMEDYNYRRRENGETKITNKEWHKIAQVLQVNFDDIFEPDTNNINIHNENGQVNATTQVQKIEYYNIPKEMVETQQEYINLLKEENKSLKEEIVILKEKLKSLES